MSHRTFAEAEQDLAAALPGYTPRPQQQRAAQAIEQTLETGGQALVEAGTGVGKSFAALIPAIESGQRVIVVTATKALQDQYMEKDLPFLAEHLSTEFTYACLKGKANYVCRDKLATADSANADAIRAELADAEEHSGEIGALATQLTTQDKMAVTITSADCPGRQDCPLAAACFAEIAKDNARKAQIVVVNAALLMTDLIVRKGSRNAEGREFADILDEYDAVIIDEGHELAEIATNSLSTEMRANGIIRLTDEVASFGRQQGEDFTAEADRVRLGAEELWMMLEDLVSEREPQHRMTAAWIVNHGAPFADLVAGLRDLVARLMDFRVVRGGEAASGKKKRLIRRAINAAERLEAVLFSPDSELVRWAELENRGGRTNLLLKASPLSVAPFMAEMLWERKTAVLVSATLSVGGDYSYIAETLGLVDPTFVSVGTPFDYQNQARLFVPDTKVPAPAGKDYNAWQSYANSTTLRMVTEVGGGALLLFTSTRAMKAAYGFMAPELAEQGITCLIQDGSMDNKALAERFKNDTDSVLFGLKSFMVGVDFPGDTLRLVVVDKLPFPVPSDILFAARCDEINRQANDRWASFNRLTIPVMALTLEQAFGRLIRTQADRGVVAILDSRLRTKGYGKRILAALPPAPQVDTPNEAIGFVTEPATQTVA